MKKLTVIAIFTIGGIVFLSLEGQSGSQQESNRALQPNGIALSQNIVMDTVQEKKAAIRPILPKVAKAKTVQSILKASELGQYQSQVLGGMKASIKANKIDPEKWNSFAENVSEYPIEKEFEEMLKDYSQEELNYLLGHIEHPAQKQMKEAQKEKQDELIKITQSKEDYKQDPKKAEKINEIFEETKALESTMAISDAVTEPILMAMFKQKNPKANVQEMEAFAAKVLRTKKADTKKMMNNVLLWSFNQIDQPTLEDLSQYVTSYSDQNINDKYLADLKKFYRKYGRFIGTELTKLYQ
ncbi:MAG: hypothetical protein NXH75_08475 [Halobacteriovoraceae bacterium]|nr:hypothetical protein [Halobacteriovoraceae bacterium]